MEVRQRVRWFYTQLSDPQRLSEQQQEFPWGCLSASKHTLRSDGDPWDQIQLICSFFMTLKAEMPSLTALRSWNNSLSFPVKGHRSRISIRGTETLQNMGLNNDLWFFFSFRIYYLCCGLSLPHLPLHSRWFCCCLHQGHWEASRRRGSDSLSADEGT